MIRILILFFMVSLAACQQNQTSTSTQAPAEQPTPYESANSPAPGFNEAASDQEAIAIADRVMESLGGRKAWDTTRYIEWNFFGFRNLHWDKEQNMVRVEEPRKNTEVILNLNTREGEARVNGTRITQPDSLAKLIDYGYKAWVNDSYWLVMPFKLKDSGVTLQYLGQDTAVANAPREVLKLTFSDVGVTPQNKYHVYVNPETNMISHWAYYREANQEKPAFVMPWNNYQQYGSIMLSGDRGERKLSGIKVMNQPPEGIFSFNG